MLCRFPAEDLHPLRAVCKQWLDTIDNDPHFPLLNFAHCEPGLLIQQIDYKCSVTSYFMNVIHRPSKAIATLKPLNINPFVRIEGSCDGLLLARCVFYCVRFVINPLSETFVGFLRCP
ncbi:hypothetical protein QJS10_CPB13g01037 [Acorus calamus]|uniref:F-box domain-containing protein n=1 Tax=Acorus calamus TaxID=4465 RepID=A0AAV9DFI5_ACOCL|nr:hypothetical protein QJS10_CPB13g01037 [Acorus calamus]